MLKLMTESSRKISSDKSTKHSSTKIFNKDHLKQTLSVSNENFPIQRKASCVCGGGCPSCQAKSSNFSISHPNDMYEKEADVMADKVMQITGNQSPSESLSESIAPVIRTKREGDQTDVGTSLTAKLSTSQGNGENLDGVTRSFMQNRFGTSFSNVKIHTGGESGQMNRELKSKAFTIGSDIYFNEGFYQPETFAGKHLLAHELTHVIQQKKGFQETPAAVLTAGSRGKYSSPVIMRSPLSDQANTNWVSSNSNKARIFDFLRANSPTSDADLHTFINTIFTLADDRWLAETIMKNGPEPLWSLADITERQKRAMVNSWAAEPGNIAATLGSGSHTVEAFYFRGVSDRRALIVGGVHGSEPGGVEVVKDLLSIMRSPNAPMPFFSVIIVPSLFSANVAANTRASGGKTQAMIMDKKNSKVGEVDTPDPNRQFPNTGSDVQFNAVLGCPVDSEQRCIEPENLVLLDLINRFQPERVANVHGHSIPHATKAKGSKPARTAKENLLLDGGPSVTTDPRPGRETEDDALALSMAAEAQRLGVQIPGNFMGKKEQRTRYPTGTAPAMSKGITLGQWGSHGTPTRPAMNIILIETFGNATSTSGKAAQQAARKTELMNLAQVLRDFFLVDPSPKKP